MKSELDLEALERLPDNLRMVTVMDGRNMADFDFMPTFRALIQRLREAEAGYDNSKLMSENYVKDLQRRVELLERVREATVRYITDSTEASGYELSDALAAVEESNGR